MVHAVASMEFAPGKREEAVQFLKKAVSWFKAHGAEAQLLQRVTGAPGQAARLVTMETYDSLAAWGDVAQKMLEDAEFEPVVRQAHDPEKGCIAHNTFSRTIFEVI